MILLYICNHVVASGARVQCDGYLVHLRAGRFRVCLLTSKMPAIESLRKWTSRIWQDVKINHLSDASKAETTPSGFEHRRHGFACALSRFGESIRPWLPPINFITIHWAYFILISLFASVIFWGSANPAESIGYWDSLFLTVSALTSAGLNTVNLSSEWPQIRSAMCCCC